MAKSGYKSTPTVPEWAKLPQYKGMYVHSVETEDVDMEDIEVSLKEKLVLPGNPRLKRSRTDVSFTLQYQSRIY